MIQNENESRAFFDSDFPTHNEELGLSLFLRMINCRQVFLPSLLLFDYPTSPLL